MTFLYARFVVFCCRRMSAGLPIYINNSADNCQQYCRYMSANKLLQTVFNSYQVKGKFHGERTTFHPASRSSKGIEVPGERWNVGIKSSWKRRNTGEFLY
jgi:hypothetical protein